MRLRPRAISAPVAALAVASDELPSISGVYNFIKANTPNAIAAKGAMLEGTADMRIAYIGDSTVFGYGSDSNGFINAKVHSVTAQLADALTTAGIPASADDLWGSGEAGTPSASIAGLISAEPKLTRTGSGFVVNDFPCIGGRTIGVAGADTVSTWTLTTAKSANRCDVYFLQFSAGGSFKYSVDGGAESAAQSTLGASGMGKVTLDLGTSGAHAVTFRCNDANVFTVGYAFYDTNARRALVWNHGACGFTSGQIDAKTAAWDWGENIANPNLGLHLAIIQGGLVNDRNAVVDPAASIARIQGWITALKAVNCDVWIVNPEPVSDTTSVSFAYRDALHALADTNSVPFIDLMTPHTTLSSWAGAGFDYDTTHPNGAGYGFIAARYAAMLEAL